METALTGVELRSTLTCPECGHRETETMPVDACQWFYDCKGCGVVLKPKPGDCCVYCSYGTVRCPPMQRGSACCDEPGLSETSADWAATVKSYVWLWGVPKISVVLAAFAPVPSRMAIWTAALAWMGAACLMNARRCGRTHCRYTGPFYLILIAPALLVGAGVIAPTAVAWTLLGVLIVAGGPFIWWATEARWGKYARTSGND